MTKSSLKSVSPFWLGIATMTVATGSLSLKYGLAQWAKISATDRHSFSILTGFMLLSAIAWQWRLFFNRNKCAVSNEPFELTAHKWVGSLLFVFLFVHAAGWGASLQSFLTLGMAVVVMTGLFHVKILKLKFPKIGLVWEWVHFGVSAIMLPLMAIHIWAAFAFKAY
ncbi:MAG TPA: hypothetical protein VKT76_14795 [Bradyrhizobium sp.]|nr:hypothetical protein [Bradyrhizobium sp.]